MSHVRVKVTSCKGAGITLKNATTEGSVPVEDGMVVAVLGRDDPAISPHHTNPAGKALKFFRLVS